MSISLVVAVTDSEWFEMLRHRTDLAEVNFWAPSGANFRALQPGELFLFKLHAPRNFIVGGGIFAYANTLPCSLAWEAFGDANGATSLRQRREHRGTSHASGSAEYPGGQSRARSVPDGRRRWVAHRGR